MHFINSIEDLEKARNNNYRIGEFLSDNTQIFQVSDNDDENMGLIESYEKDELFYDVHWHGESLFTEEGKEIVAVY